MKRPPKHVTEAIVIVVINAAVYAYQWSMIPLDRAYFNLKYGAVPRVIVGAWRAFVAAPHLGLLPTFSPVLTANYLHHDVGHVVGNMLVFWVFSNVLVPLVGRQLFLVMYVLGGVVAIVVYVATNPTSEVAMIGASGAVAALDGAYFTLVFRWRIPSGEVWPFTDWSLRPRGLALLAGLNFVLDTGSFINHSREHVAFGAHVGGFLGGVAMALIVSMMKTPKLNPT